MERVTDRIRAIYLDQETNCAESLFRAALESRGIQAPADCCRMMSGYSGGVKMCIRDRSMNGPIWICW